MIYIILFTSLIFFGSCINEQIVFQSLDNRYKNNTTSEVQIPSKQFNAQIKNIQNAKQDIDKPLKTLKSNKFKVISNLNFDIIEIFKIPEKFKSPMIDLVLVLDVSSSMNFYLMQLGKYLSSLLSVISHYDWQIAVTTADHGDHRVMFFATNQSKVPHIFYQEKWQDHVFASKASYGKFMFFEKNESISKIEY